MTTMTDRPLFSIVTITRNNLDGLKRTQASLESQSAFDYEWIVIDGDSTDGTKDHLPSLAARTVSEPDNGIYQAMNKGLGLASGHYVLFLNAGDALADMDILSTLGKAVAAHKPDFLYGDALETNGFYKKAFWHQKLHWGMFTHHQAMLYHRDTIADLRYDETWKIAADYGFTARFLKCAKNAHYIPCAICLFEDGGISQKKRRLGRIEQFRIRRQLRLCSLITCCNIYAVQSVAAIAREYFPSAYFRLKKTFSRHAP